MSFPRLVFLTGLLAAGVSGCAEKTAGAPADTAESAAVTPGSAPDWRPWSAGVFAESKRTGKPVLLDLEARWCHWCHVMDEKTYADTRIQKVLRKHFITVRVDQDSRPDLANRYEDYGWPATVVFAPDGRELAKRRGFVRPDAMLTLLRDTLAGKVSEEANPGPPVVSGNAALTPAALASLRTAWLSGYDEKFGGWGFSHKFLDADTVEYALREAAGGDARAAAMSRATLRLELRIHDPVWGGAYQYSAEGWDEPHFEKLLTGQADNVRTYARAFTRTGDPAYRDAALAVHRYVRRFLTSPEGLVYVSQDADLKPGEHAADYFVLDDAARLKRGIPKVDTHLYSRQNGDYALALVALAESTGDETFAVEAERAALWVVKNRALPGGGFRHDAKDTAGPYLADTLAMGRAFLALYEHTGDTRWLNRAGSAAGFIAGNFRMPSGGFASSVATPGVFPAPLPQFDENVNLARFATALGRVTGKQEYRVVAGEALAYASARASGGERGFYTGGLLLAEREFSNEPVHVLVVGAKSDPAALALFRAALAYPDANRLIEWWDPAAGPAPRGEDYYPRSEKPAAFLCANGACSAPIEAPEKLKQRLLASVREK